MTRLTQRQAAQQWGIAWTTFRRAVKAGKVSVGADKRVDVAEMLRVYGEPVAQPETGASGPGGTSPGPPMVDAELAQLRADLAAMTVDRDRLRELVTAKDETIAAMRLLTHQKPEKRRWWPW